MFDKLLGKKKKTGEIFVIPERKFISDQKTVAKLPTKNLQQLVADQDKYIAILVEKIEEAKSQYEKMCDKCDELSQKNEVVNTQIRKMTNEHEQLTMKFDNLQSSLESMILENDLLLKQQAKFISENDISSDKIKNISSFIKIYREKSVLCKKIEQQNKILKERYSTLEENYDTLEQKYKEVQKEKGYNKLIPDLMQGLQELKKAQTQKAQQKEIQQVQVVKIIKKPSHSEAETMTTESSPPSELRSSKQLKETFNEHTECSKEIENLKNAKGKLQILIKSLQQKIRNISEHHENTQSKLKACIQEIEQLKLMNKRLNEEKKMLQEANNQCLTNVNTSSEKLKKQNETLKKQIQDLRAQSLNNADKWKNYQIKLKNYMSQIENLQKQIEVKQLNLRNMNEMLQQKENELSSVNQQYETLNQESKCKFRKYECELNQQRIKNQSLTRKATNLQAKNDQNKVSMDKMYDDALTKDKKINHMQIKLKEYKYMIQLLRKQKQELQKTYESKIQGFQLISSDKEAKIQEKKSGRSNENVSNEDDEIMLKNEIMSMKEQDFILREENQKLRAKISQLQELLTEKEMKIKSLNEKRDQMMREFQKMDFKSLNKPQQTAKRQSNFEKEAKEAKQNSNGREKKIASKAYKGFDILVKLNHQLYKSFINVFTKDLIREQVKAIEGEINVLVKKSTDMKDIFQDYL